MTGEPAQVSSASMTTSSRAVFLSYASEDAPAAQRIAETLRAAGIDVWFDQSELRGGDAWDRAIRRQIRECALFLPIISAHSQARPEGYFRLEWDLADQRTHLMGRSRAFVVPVCLDATLQKEADVPDSFVAVQWTRLPGGETPPAFVDRVRRLLSGEASTAVGVTAAHGAIERIRAPRWTRRALLTAVTVVIGGTVAYFAIDRFWISKPAVAAATVAASPPSATFTPPPHSIAVLPFVNMSGDREQEYFSDGLTEELLNALAEVNELQVAARTSAFSFKGTNADIGTIARRLNVGAVLEGSVRRSGNTVRITTQLINPITGFHLWSHTYDRDLGDVLKLESEIAGAVASALKVSLLGGAATQIELGGTRNPAAFDAYLRGRKAHLAADKDNDFRAAIAAFTEAIRLDPNYALAYANRSIALTANTPASYDKALIDGQKALALAPDLPEGHLALAYCFEYGSEDFGRANEEYERALALGPGNARVLRNYGTFAAFMGRTEAGIAAARRAVVLDPLSWFSHRRLGYALYYARQNNEAIAKFQDALTLNPENPDTLAFRGLAYYGLGDLERARASCEVKLDDSDNQWCLALTYEKLGRHSDAETQLAKLKAALGDASAYQYATIYAQWGNRAKALEWLDTARRLRAKGLELLKTDATGLEALKTDPLMDPLRNEPRFQAIERELRFPD